MNILVQLSHPAHFHLYKEGVKNWIQNGHRVFVLIKTKDILEDLLIKSGFSYYNILPVAHRKSRLGVLLDMFIRDWKMIVFCKQHHIDILTGSTAEVAQVGWLLGRKSVNTGEDDAAVVPIGVKFLKPFMQSLLSPTVCNMGVLESRTVHYPSYHELAYLHHNHFIPSRVVVSASGINPYYSYFILRFASLGAHHDKGIKGINKEIAQRLVDILKPHGQIYITSERPLEPEFEPYRIHINPLDMHHVMAFASLYIGDSQTMAAEAGVLGTPFVRFNDFVGRIGYLDELEEPYYDHNPSPTKAGPIPDGAHFERASYLANINHHYDLGIGIKASEEGSVDRLCQVVEQLASMPAEERKKIYGERRQKMLADKIDYAKFLTWFIENYPQSANQAQNKPSTDPFWQQFK